MGQVVNESTRKMEGKVKCELKRMAMTVNGGAVEVSQAMTSFSLPPL